MTGNSLTAANMILRDREAIVRVALLAKQLDFKVTKRPEADHVLVAEALVAMLKWAGVPGEDVYQIAKSIDRERAVLATLGEA